jgi:REP element-mobilizing transposase RayT
MKNRDYKQFAEGEYYHIFNRGVGKMDIFLDEQDFLFFLKRLKENIHPERMPLSGSGFRGAPSPGSYVRELLPENSFELICYCLMPNHFHLVIKQLSSISISKLIAKVCTSYSMYFNKKYNRVGTLYQDQFKAVHVADDEYLLWLSVYIHQNPHVAGLVKNLKDWKWGSYPDYIGARQGSLCKKDVVLERFKTSREYADFVDSGFDIIKSKGELKDFVLD